MSAGSRAQEGRGIKSKEKTWEQQCQDEQGLDESPRRWNRRS